MTLPLDQFVPRRGAISFSAADAGAIYVRSLGDITSSARGVCTGTKSKTSNRTMICHKSPRTGPLFRRRSTMANTKREMDKMLTKSTSGTAGSCCNCALCSEKRVPIQLQSLFAATTTKRDFARNRLSLSLRNRSLSLEENRRAKVENTLAQADHWSFDVFALHQATSGRALSNLAMHLFQKHDLLRTFNLDYIKLRKFLDFVEQDYYCANPYHNGIHAADVTQATHCFLSDQTLSQHFSKLEVMAMLLAGITHDVGHPGVNQDFLISTSSYLASIHRGTKSLLERHHCRTAKALLMKSQLLSHLPSTQVDRILDLMESCILATDMSQHKDYMTRFETLVSDDKRVDLTRPETRTFVAQMLLKCADVSNPCRPWKVSHLWSHRIMEEFYRQGDFEKDLGLNVSFLCDRTTTSVPKAQSNFIEFVVDPMFTSWTRFVGSSFAKNLCRHLDNNKASWDDIAEEMSNSGEVEDDSAESSAGSADC